MQQNNVPKIARRGDSRRVVPIHVYDIDIEYFCYMLPIEIETVSPSSLLELALLY